MAENFDFAYQHYKSERNKRLQNPSSVKETLGLFGYSSVLDVKKGELKPNEIQALETTAKDGNYFDLQFVRSLKQPFLADWSVDLKRKLLKNGAPDLAYQGFVQTENELDEMTDKKIEKIFLEFGASNPEAYRIQEMIDLEFWYTRGQEHLKQLYSAMPLAAEGADEYEAEKIRGEHIFAPMASDMAGIYDSQGILESAFDLDEELEAAADKNKEKSGNVSLENLNWMIVGLERFIKDGSTDGLAGYFLSRASLPLSGEKDDAKLINFFPGILRCQTYSELADFIKKTPSSILTAVRSGTEVKNLLSGLKSCQAEKQKFFSEHNGGLLIDRDEINRLCGCLDAHFSGRPRLTDNHFSLAIYLFDRQKLPAELRNEFEKKFGVQIPESLKSFDDFKSYLYTPTAELDTFLQSHKNKLPDMARWLDDKLSDLLKRLTAGQPRPKNHKLYEIIEQNLFNKAVTEDEKEDLVDSFGEMHSLPFRRALEKKLGLNLADLTIREQIWLLQFLRDQKEDMVDRVATCVKKYGMNFVRAFMSGEYDPSMGDAIITLAEKLPEPAARAVFAKYNELADRIFFIAEYVNKTTKREADPDVTNQIADNLLRRGKLLLENGVQDLPGKKTKELSKKIMAELEHYSADALLFSITFKALSDKEKLKFEDVRGVEFSTADSAMLDEKTRQEMLRIFASNRISSYDTKLLEQVKKEFKQVLEEKGHKFYTLKKDGELVAFLRLTEMENGNLYLGSFNTRPEVRGVSIGGSFMQTIIEEEGKERKMELVVYKKNPILKTYVDKMGFQIVEKDDNYHGTGQTFLKLVRPAEKKERTAMAV